MVRSAGVLLIMNATGVRGIETWDRPVAVAQCSVSHGVTAEGSRGFGNPLGASDWWALPGNPALKGRATLSRHAVAQLAELT